MNHVPHVLFADGKTHDGTLRAIGSIIELMALAAGEPATKPRRFQMEAYNGGAMRFFWSDVPVVVDLAGMEVGSKPRPIFKDHSPALIVGHTDKVQKSASALRVEGVVSGDGAVAREVVGAADKGFPWQASIGAEILRTEDVRAGADVTVNGQKFTGPLLIVRASRLAEVSFVALGADDSTQARMSAGRSITTVHKENSMDFEAWLKAQGFVLADLNDTQKTTLQAAHLAAHPVAGTSTAVAEESDDVADTTADDLKAARKVAADETRRVGRIRTLCAGKHFEIEAKAIEENWSADKVELEVLRASRPTGPNIRTSQQGNISAPVLEAAVLQASRADDSMTKRYDAKTLEAADKRFRGRISLQEVLLEAAWANGYSGRSFRQDPHAVLAAAFLRAEGGVSLVDIGGILSNIANKFLLEGFMGVDQVWRQISAVRPVNDFKTITSYRLTGDNTYEQVAPGGEIKHGKLGSESFTNKADTYAKLLSISRTDLINDDLGALTTVPRILGRGAALKLNDVFWTEFMNNGSFFASGNNNYFSGAATNLSIDSLTTAEQKFLDQVDADKKPIAITPKTLLVPTALSALAAQLMRSLEIRDTTASTKYATTNPHAGKFTPVVTPYLSNASISGNSSTAWHLLADPRDLAVIETVFLNGQETPTVESAQAESDTLGVVMRGYHDFGVAKQDSRAGVKSKGAA